MKRRNIIKTALDAKLRDKVLFEDMLTKLSDVRVDVLLDLLNEAWAIYGVEDIAERRDLP